MSNKCVICSESKCLYPAYDKEEVDQKLAAAEVKDGGITTNKLADLAVVAAKIANGAVTGEKIASNAICSSGTYTGTGTKQEIQVGFEPSMVFVFSAESLSILIDLYEAVLDGSEGIVISEDSSMVNPIYNLGFICYKSSAWNKLNIKYKYIAFR